MGNCSSHNRIKYGLVEYHMENEDYLQLSMLIASNSFNYEEKIPMEAHPSSAYCSYLHLAAKYNSRTFVRLWLKHGYPLNITDYRGWTALHWAVYYNSTHVFLPLIMGGINAQTKIKNITKSKNKKFLNKTAIQMSVILKRVKMFNLYTKFKKIHSQFNIPIYIPDETTYNIENLPDATALSESYIIDSIPRNNSILIQKTCNWEIYSDKYGNKVWKHCITGEIYDKRPAELRNIVTISYYAR